jgi:hypothetical protein
MKRLPLILGLIFISVTVHRVALFSGGGFNGWIVALGLAIGVFLSAYFSELKTTSKPALVALVAFVLVDSLFNVSEVLKWSVEQGRWDFTLKFSEQTSIYIYRISDPIFGIFPTLAAALLGWLSKSTERLIVNRKGNWKDRLLNGFITWIFGNDSETVPAISGKIPVEDKRLPSWLPIIPKSKEHFRQLYREGIIQIPQDITSTELAEYLPVGERQVRNWISYARNGHE